jgi:hypothetical protein
VIELPFQLYFKRSCLIAEYINWSMFAEIIKVLLELQLPVLVCWMRELNPALASTRVFIFQRIFRSTQRKVKYYRFNCCSGRRKKSSSFRPKVNRAVEMPFSLFDAQQDSISSLILSWLPGQPIATPFSLRKFKSKGANFLKFVCK